MKNESYGKFIVIDPEWAKNFTESSEDIQDLNAIAAIMAQSIRETYTKIKEESDD